MQYPGAEQRRETREELFAGEVVVVDVTSGNSTHRTQGIVLNVADCGIAVQTFRPLVTGDLANIHLASSKASLDTLGKVAWQDSSGRAGIRFVGEPQSGVTEFCRSVRDSSLHASDSPLPLFACRAEPSASEFEATLHLFACSAMALTGASGVAIATGNSGGMECRASTGSAPEIGVQLRPGGGLAGESLSTGLIIFCNDATSDSRVHPAVAEQLQARSILTVPIADDESIVGLLTAFSRAANHFNERHVHQLQPLIIALGQAISSEQNGSASEQTLPPVAPFKASHSSAEKSALANDVLANSVLDVPAYDVLADFDFPDEVIEHKVQDATSRPVLHDAVAHDSVGDDVLEPDVLEPEFNYDVFKREVLQSHKTAAAAESETAETPAPFSFLQMLKPATRSIVVAVALAIVALLLIIIAASHAARGRNVSAKATAAAPVVPQTRTVSSLPVSKPVVSFNPAAIDAVPGKTFNVAVGLKGAQNLWSAPMKIVYDPRQLQLVSVTNGGLLSSDGVSPALVHRVNAAAGSVDISISRPLAAPGISGDGAVFNLSFRAKSEGTSKLRIASSGLRDTSTRPLSIDSSEAMVTVAAPETAEAETADQQSTTQPTDSAQPSQSDSTLASTPASQQPLNPAPELAFAASPEVGKVKTSETEPLPPPVLPPTNKQIPASLGVSNAALPTLMPSAPKFILSHQVKGHSSWVTSVAFNSDGHRLLSSSWDHSLKIWESSTGRMLIAIKVPGTRVEAAALSHDGHSIAIEDEKNNIAILDASTGVIRNIIKGQRPTWDSSWTYSISFSPDDRLLAAAFDSSTIRILEVSTGRVVRDLRASPREFLFAAFSPNGRWIATGGDSKTIRLWDVNTGKPVHLLKGHRHDINAVAFSPDGRWLASASKDKTVKLWDVASGREVRTFEGHEAPVTGVAFSANGRWLATGSWDRTMRIWDVASGREVQTLAEHKHPIYSLAFASGYLATGGQDGTVNLWKLHPDVDLAVVNGTAPATRATATAPH